MRAELYGRVVYYEDGTWAKAWQDALLDLAGLTSTPRSDFTIEQGRTNLDASLQPGNLRRGDQGGTEAMTPERASVTDNRPPQHFDVTCSDCGYGFRTYLVAPRRSHLLHRSQQRCDLCGARMTMTTRPPTSHRPVRHGFVIDFKRRELRDREETIVAGGFEQYLGAEWYGPARPEAVCPAA